MNDCSQDSIVFDPPKRVQDEAHVKSMRQYHEMHKASIDDPANFWGEIAKQFYWKKGYLK